jgi:small-conductance mechanosensitive channel
MRLNPPKKNTFWAAVIIAAVGVVVYAVHMIVTYMANLTVGYLRPVAFLLVLAAFVLLCLGLTRKNL